VFCYIIETERKEKAMHIATPSDDTISVRSIPCPDCGESIVLELTTWEAEHLRINDQPIQVTLKRFDADTRERFITGFCPKCWDKMFKDD
jgi:predicted RNA-binding Zn-ribbon protein involved in translation (DUF1610 family)